MGILFNKKQVELPGFVQYRHSSAVEDLNRAYESLHKKLENVKRSTIERIGRLVSPKVRCSKYEMTTDGYLWFEELEFLVKRSRIRLLFPWGREFLNSRFHIDRSINVYKDERSELSDHTIDRFLEKFARNIESYLVNW